jgi:hypothetical protein
MELVEAVREHYNDTEAKNRFRRIDFASNPFDNKIEVYRHAGGLESADKEKATLKASADITAFIKACHE